MLLHKKTWICWAAFVGVSVLMITGRNGRRRNRHTEAVLLFYGKLIVLCMQQEIGSHSAQVSQPYERSVAFVLLADSNLSSLNYIHS